MWPEIRLALQAVSLQTSEHDASVASKSWTSITGSTDETDFTNVLVASIKAGLKSETEAIEAVEFWSYILEQKPVCVKSHDIFMVVGYQHVDCRHFYKIILGNQIGWIIWYNYIKFYEAR